ncbi:MAG: hypothetical protein ACR2HH_14475 [Chthoniobacterales bacterium]
MTPQFFSRSTLLTLALCLLAGCNKNDDTAITVYRIPKETQPTAPMSPASMTNAAGPAQVHWTAPEGWQEQPATGFRKGSFLVTGADGKTADVSVISFPEQAGGLLANVNRWRNQLKLAPITNEAEVGTPMPVAGRDMFFVDLVSAEAIAPEGTKSRILGGIFPLNGETWFFKMIGPDAVVAAQGEAFKQFLGSVHLAEAAAPAPMTAVAGASTNAPTPPLIEPPQGAPIQFTLPAGWQEKPLTPMRVASFNAGAPNEKSVDVSVVSLGGMAGGDLANVNRWRDQVKLGPIDQAALEKSAEHIKANGRDYLVVDVVSDAPIGDANEKQRIIAAIFDEGERSWFIKMTGEDAAVASQKNAFADFLRNLKLP